MNSWWWAVAYGASVVGAAVAVGCAARDIAEEVLDQTLRPTPATVLVIVTAILFWPAALVVFLAVVLARAVSVGLFGGEPEREAAADSLGAVLDDRGPPPTCRTCRAATPPAARYCRRCGRHLC